MVPGPGCGGIIIINPVSLQLQLAPGSTNFSSHTPLCLPEGIYSPFLAVLYMNGKTDKQFMPKSVGPRPTPGQLEFIWTCHFKGAMLFKKCKH